MPVADCSLEWGEAGVVQRLFSAAPESLAEQTWLQAWLLASLEEVAVVAAASVPLTLQLAWVLPCDSVGVEEVPFVPQAWAPP